MPAELKYRRVLLKVSGEALMGEREYGLDPVMVERIAGEIQSVHDLGVELCLVIGGGNIFRGLAGAAVGMHGFFAETHPEPGSALSDGPNAWPLDQMKALMGTVQRIAGAAHGR